MFGVQGLWPDVLGAAGRSPRKVFGLWGAGGGEKMGTGGVHGQLCCDREVDTPGKFGAWWGVASCTGACR